MQHIHKMINDFSDDNYKLCRVKEILGFTKKNLQRMVSDTALLHNKNT